jgi:hypothetical protein
VRNLDAFRNVKRAGDGWLATCPAHDDQRASLSIGAGEGGRVLLHCHAGCALDDILAAAHLEHTDLFPETTTTTKATIVATYPYYDEGGLHLFDVVRFAPKDFRQRRADGVWKMHGVRRVLYHLPELQGQTIAYVVEGERDADRLRAMGFPGTTAPGGAGKWRPEYPQQLTGASVEHVVILPDNDEPGRAHAEQVARSCHAAGLQVKVVALPGLPPKGDVSDWLDAGGTKTALIALVKQTARYAPSADQAAPSGRSVRLTPASAVTPRPVRWLWEGRVALGTVNLLGGREGIGKSIVECTLTADITRGRLPGIYVGTPRAVIIAATEDSWEYTIVPRLMAAGADLARVFRVDVETPNGADATLSLPRDLPAVERLILDQGAVAMMLDPILSRLDAGLDSHKDGEVRQALEPLVAVAERTGCSVLGLIHVNKSTSSDPLTTLMASRAFAAVARAVLFVMIDPDDETTRLLGQPKNNLGRSDLPTLAFQIAGAKVAETDEGPVWTGKLHWTGETDRSIRDALQQAAETAGANRTVVSEAADWLEDYLKSQDGSADSADVKKEGGQAGHSKDALQRARVKLKITTVSVGFPRRTHWTLQSSHQLSQIPGESATTTTTKTTAANWGVHTEAQSTESLQSSQSSETPRASATTVWPTNGSGAVPAFNPALAFVPLPKRGVQ